MVTVQRRKRKNRWGSAQGVVIAVRLPATVYGSLERTAAAIGLPTGLCAKQLLEKELLRRSQPHGLNWL